MGDVLFYTLSTKDVDQTSPVTVVFDRPLSVLPAVVTEANKASFDPGAPSVRLAVVSDPDLAMPLPSGSLVDCTLASAGNRELSLSPAGNLKPGVTYELKLENLSNDAEKWCQV